MLKAGERVVVAVSGGADSVAMLYALNALARPLRLQLAVAHVNHGLRASAAEDEAFVASLAEQFRLPFYVRRVNPGEIGLQSVEANARAWRYHYLREVAREAGATKVATGHTLDDQAETVLMRIARGAGWRGLRGILPVREDGVIRPLIQCSRQEVRCFLQRLGARWQDDETNADPRFLRNHVRHFVLPVLTQMNPGLAWTLARLADVAQRDWAVFQQLINEKIALCTSSNGALALQRVRGFDPHVQRAVVHAWLSHCVGAVPLPGAAVARAFQVVESNKEGEFPLGPNLGWLIVANGHMSFQRSCCPGQLKFRNDWGPYPFEPGGRLCLPNGWMLLAEECDARAVSLETNDRTCRTAYFDAAALRGSLAVRPARPGDRIVPFGMSGSRKLQDVFTDRHVHRSERWGRPVITAGETILWVPGVVRSNHAPLTPVSNKALKFHLVTVHGS